MNTFKLFKQAEEYANSKNLINPDNTKIARDGYIQGYSDGKKKGFLLGFSIAIIIWILWIVSILYPIHLS